MKTLVRGDRLLTAQKRGREADKQLIVVEDWGLSLLTVAKEAWLHNREGALGGFGLSTLFVQMEQRRQRDESCGELKICFQCPEGAAVQALCALCLHSTLFRNQTEAHLVIG